MKSKGIADVKKTVLLCLTAIAVSSLFAAEIPSGETVDGVYRPDWEALVTANEAKPQRTVIPAGETWIAYESDMEWIRGIGDLREGDFANFQFQIRGTLILENTTTWFRGYQIDGVGATYIKRGATTNVADKTEFNAGGKLIIEEGMVVYTNPHALGHRDALPGGDRMCDVEVRDGATLKTESSIAFGQRNVKIAGSGVNGEGAFIAACNLSAASLTLSDDAFVVDAGCGDNFGPSVDLAGHTLTLGTAGSGINLNNVDFTDPGSLVFAGSADAASTFKISGTTAFPAGIPVTISGDSRLLFNTASATAVFPLTLLGDVAICSVSSADLVFDGVISGEGNVSFGDADYPAKGSVVLGNENTWTGTTVVNGDSGFLLMLKYASSIPDFSKLTLAGGTLVPVPGYDDGVERWSAADLLSFASTYQVSESAREIKFDTTELTGASPLEISSSMVAEYFPSLDVIWNATGSGSGSYTLTGPYTTEKPLDIDLTGGTIRLSGDDRINLGDVLVSGTSASEGGTLVLDGAKDVVFGEQVVKVGAASASSVIGRLVITNSVLRSTLTEERTDGYQNAPGHLWIGTHAKGVLELEEGGIVSNKVYTGGGGVGSLNGSGVGAVYQRGGVFAPVVNNQSYAATTLGIRGYGFYQLEGGTVRPWNPAGEIEGWFAVGGYTDAIFIQTGGIADFTGVAALTVGANNNGSGTYCVRKGTTTVNGLDSAQAGGPGTGVFTVDGPEAGLIVKGGTYFCANPEGADKRTIVNINRGGVFETKNFYTPYATADYPSAYPVAVNFNGGVLRTLAVNGSVFAPDETRYVAKVAVYEDGMTIENANTVDTLYTPIVAAGEGGIRSVTLEEPVGGLIAPNVKITGPEGAYGATAIAEFDLATRTVTNILVTSRGWGYTAEGTSVVLRDGATAVKTLPFTVGTNVAGGFTKQGAGLMDLYNVNTWAQWTKVLGGTLRLAEEGAVPDGTELTLSNGATLDLNGFEEPVFSGLSGTGGTVVNGSLVISGELRVSAEKFLTRETTAIDGTLDLSAVTEICLTDAEMLTEEMRQGRSFRFFTATSVVLPDSVIPITGVPCGWGMQLTAGGLRLSPVRGFRIIVR